jgi:hypothetical protein
MEKILRAQDSLLGHPVYQTFDTLDGIRRFMEAHVFAVWDFMSLLKSLQRQITCVTVPWRPSPYPSEMVRLINQIVLGEESDLDQEGEAASHFSLYLRGMEEVGADASGIKKFLESGDLTLIPSGVREFVTHTLQLAQTGSVVEVASSFFFGREKLIPPMFQLIVDTLEKNQIQAPTFLYYLRRHIEVDSEEHGPLAMRCLESLIQGDEEARKLAEVSGLEALKMRSLLWDSVVSSV